MIRVFRPFRKPSPIKDAVGTLLVLGTALLYTFEGPDAARAPACDACEETPAVQPIGAPEESAPTVEPAEDPLRRVEAHPRTDIQEAFEAMYRRILVPLDGSEFAELALPYALSISRRAGGEVELVSVEEDESAYPTDEWSLAARQWAGAYLEDTRERILSAAGGPVTTELLQGKVWEALVRRTAEADADLVVMATHGRGALSRAWLGSVADAVVRHADLPVLLVRPGEDRARRAAADEDVTLEHILMPLDGSDFSRSILEPALALGSLFEARYTVLRVLALPTELASPYLPHPVQMNVELVAEAREAALASTRAVAAELEGRGFRAQAEVVVDAQAGQAILRRAAELDCEAIALATHARGGMSRMILGSTSDKVIRGAQRPVLVLRPEDTRTETS